MDDNIEQNIKKPLILIADDTPKNLQILGNLLSNEGYEIAAAVDSLQTLEICKDIIPDLILLDIMMPNMDGYEICRLLKESSITSEIPVIFITGKTDNDDIVMGFDSGAIDYITKPYNSTELIVRVRTHIKLKQSMDMQNKLISELQDALAKVKKLSGLLPICSGCKKIRDDNGYWNQVEEYVASHTEAEFSHGLCPDCLKRLYPEYAEDILDEV